MPKKKLKKSKQNKTIENAIMKIAELIPAPYNPRKISVAAANGLEKSLDEFGVVEPIVVNKRTGHVIGGNQRLKALKKAGIKETDVRLVDLPKIKEKALNIALNNPHTQGEFTGNLDGILDEIRKTAGSLYKNLNLGPLVSGSGPASGAGPEVEFSEELLLEHNYIVMYFDNPFDWQVAQEIFGLKKVKDLIPRKGQPTGVGRVIKGGEWLSRIK